MSVLEIIEISGGLQDGVAGFATIDDVLVERGATEDSGDFRARLIRMAESMNARTLVIGGLPGMPNCAWRERLKHETQVYP